MTIEEFKKKLEYHDWYYYFSDDGTVYRRGEEAAKLLVNETKNGTDEMKRAYNAEHAKHFNRTTFHPESGTYQWPYPDVESEPPPPPTD